MRLRGFFKIKSIAKSIPYIENKCGSKISYAMQHKKLIKLNVNVFLFTLKHTIPYETQNTLHNFLNVRASVQMYNLFFCVRAFQCLFFK